MSENISLQEKIFQTILHHEADRRYIYVDEAGVSLKFPLKIQIDFTVDSIKLSLDRSHKEELLRYIRTVFESNLKREGFVCRTEFSEDGEVEFYKATSDFDEARTAVKWAMRCKHCFGL